MWVDQSHLIKIFRCDLGEYLDKSRGIKVSDLSICHVICGWSHLNIRNSIRSTEIKLPASKSFWTLAKFRKTFCCKWRVIKFHYQNKEIEEVENYNVLGITFYSGDRRFQSNYNRLQEKATRAILSTKQLTKWETKTPFLSCNSKFSMHKSSPLLTMVARFGTKGS